MKQINGLHKANNNNNESVNTQFKILRALIFTFTLVFVLTPVYKYYELNGLPKINLSAVRFVLFLVSYIILVMNISKIIDAKFFKYVLCFLLLHLIITCLFIFNYTYITDYAENITVLYLERADAIIVNTFMFFFLGMFYVKQRRLNSKSIFISVFSLWLMFVAFTVVNIGLLSSVYGANILDGSGISYMFFSDRIALLSIILFNIVKNKKGKIFILCGSLGLLFLYPSRTSFYVFIISIILPYILRFDFKTLSLAILGAILIILGINNLQNEAFKNSRIFAVSLENNTSLDAREDIFRNNYGVILDNLIVGDFMSDVRIARRGGYEIHNFLAFLQDFGLVVFIPFMIFILICSYSAMRLVKKKGLMQGDMAMIGIFFFTLILAIFSRSHLAPYIFIVLLALPQLQTLNSTRFVNRKLSV